MVPSNRTVRGVARLAALLLSLAAFLCLPSPSLLPAAATRSACPEPYFQGVAPVILNPKLAAGTQELCFSRFAVVHSGITRTPLWSAEHLTREGLSAAEGLVRVNRFHPEEALPAGSRAELYDYARSGYDRGHMAPNGDMPDPQAQYESFSLANIVPQDPESNRGVWQKIEISVRALARRRGELYVVTGPLFRGAELKRIGGRVMVPSHVYKAVLDPGKGKAAAYLVENGPTGDYRVLSVAELGELSGIDLFPTLAPSARREAMNLPKPSRGGGRRGSGRGGDDGADAAMRELRRLLR
jgi:endonuclease G